MKCESLDCYGENQGLPNLLDRYLMKKHLRLELEIVMWHSKFSAVNRKKNKSFSEKYMEC